MKKVIRLTESDLHRIVKNSVKRIINEGGDSEGGQYLLGRLAQRNGEPKDAKSRMRKDKDKYPIFNYAEKAAKKAGLTDKDYQYGRRHQRSLEDFDATEDDKTAAGIAAAHGIFGPWLNHAMERRRRGEDVPTLDGLTRDELRKEIYDYDDEMYFPKK